MMFDIEQPSSGPAGRLFLFVHVPKCAGSSVRLSVIDPSIQQSRISRWPGSARLLFCSADMQYLVGHFPYGVHRLLRPLSPVRRRDPVYFSVGRDPVEQMVSLYRYYVRLGMVDESSNSGGGTVDFVRRYGFGNMQCHAHAGLSWWHPRSPLRAIGSRLPKVLLLRAKKNILKRYCYFLLQSCLDEQLPVLAADLGLQYRKQDEASTRTDRESFMASLESHEKLELEGLASADISFFQWVKGNISRNGIAVKDWNE